MRRSKPKHIEQTEEELADHLRKRQIERPKTARTIPQIRERMHSMADELRALAEEDEPLRALAVELHLLAEETKRRRYGVVKRIVDKPITPAQRAKVRAIHARHPDMAQIEISRMTGINAGRVSEAIRGFRGART